MTLTEEAAKALRAPFPESAIGKLPRGGTQLDYVGHAAVTDRLLEVDPEWSWEPVAFAEDGAPLIRTVNGEASMWIRLTVCGVTRIGVGIVREDAFELSKQLISDALRNAAMRFGVALDLWSKETLHEPPPEPPAYDPMEGWESREAAKDCHALLSERIGTLGAADKDRVRAACATWPMNAADFAAVEKLLVEIDERDAGIEPF